MVDFKRLLNETRERKMAKKTGTELATASAGALAKAFRNQMAESAKAQVAAEPVYSTANIIRMKGGDFFLNDAKLAKPVSAVVLGWAFGQFMYEEEYDSAVKTPPVCFALSSVEGELRRSDTSPKPQTDGPCATCPMNKPGSGRQGGWTRACSGRRRLGLLLTGDTSEDPQIGSMEISASGLKPFAQHIKAVSGVHTMPMFMVETMFDTELSRKGEGSPFIVPILGKMLWDVRPEWLAQPKGVKLGTLEDFEGLKLPTGSIIARKVRELFESKQLLAPPSLQAPAPQEKRPVTGAKRVSVKEAADARAKSTGKKAAKKKAAA